MTLQEFINANWPAHVDTTKSHVLLIQLEGINHFYVHLSTVEELRQGWELAQINEVVTFEDYTARIIYKEMTADGKVYQRGVFGGVRPDNTPWDEEYTRVYHSLEARHVANGWDSEQVHNLEELEANYQKAVRDVKFSEDDL